MITIVVTKRSSDWHACIEGAPEYWGCGSTPAEAIGQLVMAHTPTFKVAVKI